MTTPLEHLTQLIHSQEGEILDWDYNIDCEDLAQTIINAGWQPPKHLTCQHIYHRALQDAKDTCALCGKANE